MNFNNLWTDFYLAYGRNKTMLIFYQLYIVCPYEVAEKDHVLSKYLKNEQGQKHIAFCMSFKWRDL